MERIPPHLWSDRGCEALDDGFPGGWVEGFFAIHRGELSHRCSLAVVETALTFQNLSLRIRQQLAGSWGRVNDPFLPSTHHRTHVPFPICQASKVQMPFGDTLMTTRAWHHFLAYADVLPKSEILRALEDVGVSTYPLDLDAPSSPGMLVFDKITPQLCDLLREVSHSGLQRVLAIALSRSALVNDGAWRLLQAGASDVFSWDHSDSPTREVAARFERWASVDRLVCSPLVQNNLVGQSPVWTSVLRQIVEVARFTDASILITGETGTGKELVARLVHTLDPRSHQRDLVVLDCTTIVQELSGSEFFGHERGAFTGAVVPREGAFALADNGTLFLDEVGDLPAGLQAQLLRVVQEGTYKRVGGNTWQQTNFRLVCATNKELPQEVTKGKFRADLYYRIASWTCRLPSLRERVEDILPLARHFMRRLQADEEPPELDESVRAYLLKREYPGNVRDLRQVVSRIMYRHVGPGPITVGDILEEERPPLELGLGDWRDTSFEHAIRRALGMGIGLKEIGRAVTETAIRIAVGEEEGNLRRAAQKLGVTDRALQMRRAARRQHDHVQHVDQTG
jgi:transcriptional regulator with GAF, ATPase, and Fis domain